MDIKFYLDKKSEEYQKMASFLITYSLERFHRKSASLKDQDLIRQFKIASIWLEKASCLQRAASILDYLKSSVSAIYKLFQAGWTTIKNVIAALPTSVVITFLGVLIGLNWPLVASAISFWLAAASIGTFINFAISVLGIGFLGMAITYLHKNWQYAIGKELADLSKDEVDDLSIKDWVSLLSKKTAAEIIDVFKGTNISQKVLNEEIQNALKTKYAARNFSEALKNLKINSADVKEIMGILMKNADNKEQKVIGEALQTALAA